MQEFLFGDGVVDALDFELEHVGARLLVWQVDVDSLLESPSEGIVELPRRVGRTHNEHSFLVITTAIHLNKEFCFDSPR